MIKIRYLFPIWLLIFVFVICFDFVFPSVAKAINGMKTLRESADERGFIIGTAVDANQIPAGRNDLYTTILKTEFNKASTENELTWNHIETYGFWGADQIVNFALQNGMVSQGFHLLWHWSNPRWLIDGIKNGTYVWNNNTNTLLPLLQDHINSVVGRYKGKIKYWSVVNEAIYPWPVNGACRFRDYTVPLTVGDPGNPANPFFPDNTKAYEAIKNAFIWAHQADPDAILMYNDYGAEEINFKSDCIYNLLSRLKADHVPINAVGFQMHIHYTGLNLNSLRSNIQRLVNLGLEVHITEMDVTVPLSSPTPQDFQTQAQVYRDILDVCLTTNGCESLQTWGINDQFSWRSIYQPTLFDANFQPKPAYYSVLQVLNNGVLPPAPTPESSPTPTPGVLGDINNDGIVNIQDFILLSNAFGTSNTAADLNADGIVNIQDFIILSNNFGK